MELGDAFGKLVSVWCEHMVSLGCTCAMMCDCLYVLSSIVFLHSGFPIFHLLAHSDESRALGQAKPANGLEEYRRINVTYLSTFLDTISNKLGSSPTNTFRLAYVSGMAASRDPKGDQSLWFMGDARRIRVRPKSCFSCLLIF